MTKIQSSNSHRTFTKIDHIPSHKTGIKNFKRLGNHKNKDLLSDQNRIKSEIKDRKDTWKNPEILRD